MTGDMLIPQVGHIDILDVNVQLRAKIKQLTAEIADLRLTNSNLRNRNEHLTEENGDLRATFTLLTNEDKSMVSSDVLRKRFSELQAKVHDLQSRLESNTAEAMVQSCEQYPPVYHPTRREYFAAAALSGLEVAGTFSLPHKIECCLENADALIAALDALDAETNGYQR
jgi:FtsZ-binding cell division protein ZapB